MFTIFKIYSVVRVFHRLAICLMDKIDIIDSSSLTRYFTVLFANCLRRSELKVFVILGILVDCKFILHVEESGYQWSGYTNLSC